MSVVVVNTKTDPVNVSVPTSQNSSPLVTRQVYFNPSFGQSYYIGASFSMSPIANTLTLYTEPGSISIPVGTYTVYISVNTTGLATSQSGGVAMMDVSSALPNYSGNSLSNGVEINVSGNASSSAPCPFSFSNVTGVNQSFSFKSSLTITTPVTGRISIAFQTNISGPHPIQVAVLLMRVY